MGTPADYGLSHEQFRLGQEEMILAALAIQPGMFKALEMPTGGGKSAVAAAAASRQPVTYLASTIMLLAQIQENYGFQGVYGRDRYPCPYLHSTADACCFTSDMKQCPEIRDCDYYAAREAAKRAEKRALSYAYYWHARWPKANPGKVFCDEAQLLPDTMLDLVGIEMSPRTREVWHLPDFPGVNGTGEQARVAIADWSQHALAQMAGRHTISLNRLGAYDRLRAKLEGLAPLLDQGDWYVSAGIDKLFAKPLTPAPFMQMLKETEGTILMSATIPPFLDTELDLPGLTKTTFPHPIPAERRPVFFVTNAPAMGARRDNESDEALYERFDYQAALIARILRTPPMDHYRGVIHISRWSECMALAGRLVKYGVPVDRLWTPLPGTPTDVQVEAFKNIARDDLVALAPNWREGLDLHDDLARFAVIAKCPWRYWGDPFTRARASRPNGGRKWYDADACMAVVQGAGRVVRSAEDFGMTFIVDKSWTRVKRFAPEWFQPIAIAIEP